MNLTNETILAMLETYKNAKTTDKENIEELFLTEFDEVINDTVKKYKNKSMDEDDLYQTASIELISTIRNFNTASIIPFEDTLKRNIEKAIITYVEDESKEQSISVYISTQLNKILDSEESLIKRLGRYPSDEEVAADADIPMEDFKNLKEYSLEALALDKTDENRSKLLTELVRMHESTPIDSEKDENYELLNMSLDTLSDTEKDILVMAFGLNNTTKRSYDEIGRIYEISTEKVRQIVNLAQKKLKREMEDNND